MSRGGWPLRLRSGELVLQPLRFRDRTAWNEVRAFNVQWLKPWEATRPAIDPNQLLPSFYGMVHFFNQEARAARALSFGLFIQEGRQLIFVGQITLGGISLGAYRGAHIGYWIDQRYAGRGYVTRAVKELTRFAFEELQLHRIEINMRPENEASAKVAQKCGYIFEGMRPRYLHIDGEWRDHLVFVAENPVNLG